MASSSPRPLAVVTGASSGIGLDLARQFAINGFDLVIAAQGPEIDDAKADLEAHDGQVEAVRADLATNAGVDALYGRVTALGRPLDAVAINAGVGVGGAFRDTDLEAELHLIDVNIRGAVHLTKHVVRAMTARGRGRILFTSSIASTHPDPFEAIYGASKTFLQSFAKALRTELGGSGVTVTTLLPGPTETNFFHRAGMADTKIGASTNKDDAADVARAAFEAMMAGEEQVVTGGPNKAIAVATRLLPDRAKAALHGKLASPGSAEE